MAKSCYIHVPFCDSICSYCDFERCKSHPVLMDKWLHQIIKDIESRKDEDLKTIYIGGGTPSALSVSQLDELLTSLDHFHPMEYTIEANIENLTTQKIQLLVKHKINRISLGVQTLDNDLLKIINRKHTKESIFSKIEEINKSGIQNISVDMIYGLPTQTLEIWERDLNEIASNPYISHISIYSLTIEENSTFGRNRIEKVSEELDEEMYFKAIECLRNKGFHQYEISNFARNNHESCHNKAYWKYEDFIGIGCGAYGKENHIYYHIPFNINDYIHQMNNVEKTYLEKEDEMFESIMMSLRMKEGIDIEYWNKQFSCDLINVYADAIQKNIQLSNLVIENGFLRCSEKGFGLLNTILVDFIK